MKREARLREMVAVITGAAGDGIGRAIALGFAREGARIAVLDVRDSSKTLALLTALGATAIATRADVGDQRQMAHALSGITKQLGPIQILVTAAAIITRKPFLELSLKEWDEVQRVNLRGTFIASQWVARDMAARGVRGSIINIASIAGLVATKARAVHYCASKGGVLMLTRAMAVELAPMGIRVNAILPGTIETDINRRVLADRAQRRLRTSVIPLAHVGAPADIVGAAVLLASRDSGFMTGSTVVIDGGQTAW